MKIKLFFASIILFLFALTASAQGGKAEPLRLSFAKGKSSITKTDTLGKDQTFEMVFGAKAGQKVKIRIVSTVPKGKFHYFSLFGDGFDFATQYDKNYEYSFTAPQTGDYRLDVNFNATSKVTKGKFALTLTITN
jgi:hypothetical protein